ncbi:HEAT repeat domain-containing protein [Xenorhabdus sp. M]|uniref:HEAT repeat domain-containing protein n=1 Tax=Xenorhabdus szentirmaii TaxID=290112 RepID=A0AAW3YXL1_9GAMM|nr:HEAT repeat domain-containing protein [Xenorhabdus sp. M]MBD2802755.1 HEAT repeat domain-containing protein [Xenorhabdus sp. M]
MLPDLWRLLGCQRDQHQGLVYEVLAFLSIPQNRWALLEGLRSHDKRVSRCVVAVLCEHELCSPIEMVKYASDHTDPMTRLRAVQHQLRQPDFTETEIIQRLLKDQFAPIKQAVLQYLIDYSVGIPQPALVALLFDSNTLVRQRAAKILAAREIDSARIYLDILQSDVATVSERCAALVGLNELKHPDAVDWATRSLDRNYPRVYMAALHILVENGGEMARDHLFEAFIHPSVKVGKCALKLRDRKKIFITLTEVQNFLCEGQSEKKCRLYFSLARRLNKWDCLIFILSNLQGDRRQLSNEYLEYWINQFNCSGIPPTVKQKEIISLLMASASHLISRYQKELKCFLS